jgi:hypothetical protein
MTYEIEKEFKATINFPYIEDDRDSIIKGINLIAKGYRNQVFCYDDECREMVISAYTVKTIRSKFK